MSLARWIAAMVLPPLMAAPAFADDARLAQAERLMRAGELPAALSTVEQVEASDPRHPQARFLKGVILMDLQRDTEAMAVFVALTQDFPELPDPYNNIALLHARAGHLETARVALEAALRNDPQHEIARENLGDVYLRLAVQAWESSAAAAAPDAPVQRKLRAARELLQAVHR